MRICVLIMIVVLIIAAIIIKTLNIKLKRLKTEYNFAILCIQVSSRKLKGIHHYEDTCQWCKKTVMLRNKIEPQNCPNCGGVIMPCKICDKTAIDCKDCFFERKNEIEK